MVALSLPLGFSRIRHVVFTVVGNWVYDAGVFSSGVTFVWRFVKCC